MANRIEHKIINEEECKYCGTCRKFKPLNTFVRNKNSWDGLNARCKECKCVSDGKQYTKYYPKNKNEFQQRSKNYTQRKKQDPVYYVSDPSSCFYCGSTDSLTDDHILALSAGGPDVPYNKVRACQHCNFSKGNEEVVVWFMRQPFFNQEKLQVLIMLIICGRV